MTQLMTFAFRLRAARKASGFTVKELARRANVTYDIWVEMEYGTGWQRCGIQRIERLAAAVNCTIENLID